MIGAMRCNWGGYTWGERQPTRAASGGERPCWKTCCSGGPSNAVTDLIDAPVERGLAGKTAFIDADRTLSYGDLQARSCRFASALSDIGLRAEERLALLLYDTVDFPVAF